VENDSFDVVICTEVMEHVVDPQKLIQEISRILKPGGLLLLSAPLGSGLHQEPHHYYGGFTPYWYRHFFPKFGFCDLDITANAGSFSFFAQESLRFARLSIPTHLYAPLLIRIAWAPFWIILAPLLCILIPLLARFLDRYDTGKHFTVGYHVQARKKPA
jgi:SAM-dependent methyltransferase